MTTLKKLVLPIALLAAPYATQAQDWRDQRPLRRYERAPTEVFWEGNCRVEQRINRRGELMQRRTCEDDGPDRRARDEDQDRRVQGDAPLAPLAPLDPSDQPDDGPDRGPDRGPVADLAPAAPAPLPPSPAAPVAVSRPVATVLPAHGTSAPKPLPVLRPVTKVLARQPTKALPAPVAPRQVARVVPPPVVPRQAARVVPAPVVPRQLARVVAPPRQTGILAKAAPQATRLPATQAKPAAPSEGVRLVAHVPAKSAPRRLAKSPVAPVTARVLRQPVLVKKSVPVLARFAPAALPKPPASRIVLANATVPKKMPLPLAKSVPTPAKAALPALVHSAPANPVRAVTRPPAPALAAAIASAPEPAPASPKMETAVRKSGSTRSEWLVVLKPEQPAAEALPKVPPAPPKAERSMAQHDYDAYIAKKRRDPFSNL